MAQTSQTPELFAARDLENIAGRELCHDTDNGNRKLEHATFLTGIYLNRDGKLLLQFGSRHDATMFAEAQNRGSGTRTFVTNEYASGQNRIDVALRMAGVPTRKVHIRQTTENKPYGPALLIDAEYVARAVAAIDKLPALNLPTGATTDAERALIKSTLQRAAEQVGEMDIPGLLPAALMHPGNPVRPF
jgi:hypothetical protein